MFRLNKIFLLAGGIFVGFIAGQIWDLPYKYVLKQSFLKQYGNHVFHCDNAMKQHFIAKSRLVSSPSTETINSLKSQVQDHLVSNGFLQGAKIFGN